MNFLSLFAFWFALTIPAVVLLYLLKKKRRLHLVSSTLLWERFLNESQANSPFQKLRRSFLLLLQILLLMLAVLALARPYLADARLGGSLQVVVVDTSASMKSIDVEPSRFEAARELALGLVDGMRDTDQMVVLTAGARTTVAQSPTSEKATLRRAIGNLEATDAPTRLLEGIELAGTLVKDRPDSEVHLISDGAVSALSDLENIPVNLVFHRVGSAGNNVGLTNMDIRPNPEDPSTRAVFSSIVNYSTNHHRLAAELWLDGLMIESRTVEVEGGQTRSLVFLARQEKDGVFRMVLGVDDDLAVDNRAEVVSLVPEPARVLLYTPGNAFLEKALRATDAVDLSVTGDAAAPAEDADIVVLDGIVPLEWPGGNVMGIDVVHTNWFSSWERVDAPPIMDWKSSHPILRFVTFDEVLIAESWLVSPPWWGESVVDSSLFPLIIAGDQKGNRRIWIAFDTLESTWPYRISFPVFMANAMDWLHPGSARGQSLNVRTGEPVRVGYPAGGEEVRVRRPGGREDVLAIDESAVSFLYGTTEDQGIYTVGSGADQVRFSANLLDAEESDTMPRSTITLGEGETGIQVEATDTLRADLEMWRWIAALALMVLMYEWWYYHRRTS